MFAIDLSIFPFIFIFEIFLLLPHWQLLEYSITWVISSPISVCLFHYFTNPLFVFYVIHTVFFLFLYWLLTHPKVLHLYLFYSILNLSYHPLFSLIVAQLCSLIPVTDFIHFSTFNPDAFRAFGPLWSRKH